MFVCLSVSRIIQKVIEELSFKIFGRECLGTTKNRLDVVGDRRVCECM